jgi:diguanylate cyclase
MRPASSFQAAGVPPDPLKLPAPAPIIPLYTRNQAVPEPTDWKQKYRDSLLEMESEEKRWREVERLLRRLIGRLCAAGLGVDSRLDEELTALAAANRRNAEAAELEQLAASLTIAVVAVDGVPPAAHAAPTHAAPAHAAPAHPASTNAGLPDATSTAVAALLERLKPGAPSVAPIQELLVELTAAKSDAALAAIVERAADMIHERGELLVRERLQAAALLSAVTERLEEVAGYLTESNSASRSRFDDTQSLNDTVMLHVRELTEEMSEATELSVLQTAVTARLESVARRVSDFRVREQTRLVEYNVRAEHMRARITDLERETQELHSKLDIEKHVARIDPLTGIPNRKSFEERFAMELASRTPDGAPLAMLLWDIDSFKGINDRYGHRAGDRVLQSVAACFTAALRPADFVARIGGEEFAVLLTGMTLAEAVLAANQVRTAVAGLRFHFRGTPVRVTVSCGITELHHGDASAQAFDRADAALYSAKNAGRNVCVAA